MTKKRMDAHTAVFNNHVNDADAKARAEIKKQAPELLNKLEKFESKHGGVVGIFKKKPKTHTVMYVTLVTYFVNEGCEN